MSDIQIANLIRSRRRSIALIVTPEATLTVRAPLHTPLSFIEDLIQKKAAWIHQRVREVQGRTRTVPWTFVEGEEFLFLGKPFRLKYSDGDRIELNGDLLFPRDFLSRGKEEMTFWYRQQALRLILERVEHNAGAMALRPSAVHLSDTTSRWASCAGEGVLRFNWRLIMTPMPVLDYVVIHELAHLIVRNHSARFWSKVREFCPDYRVLRSWLRNNQERIIPR
jgi:predicted metal-dependent hydrolase